MLKMQRIIRDRAPFPHGLQVVGESRLGSEETNLARKLAAGWTPRQVGLLQSEVHGLQRAIGLRKRESKQESR